jgi:hypothetical protein
MKRFWNFESVVFNSIQFVTIYMMDSDLVCKYLEHQFYMYCYQRLSLDTVILLIHIEIFVRQRI